MDSEAKQTETSEFGAEKGLLQDHARGFVPPPKKALTPQENCEAFLKAKLGERRQSQIKQSACDWVMVR